jgi:hypothetical protein
MITGTSTGYKYRGKKSKFSCTLPLIIIWYFYPFNNFCLSGATCNVFAKFLIPMCLFKLNVLGNCSDWKQLVQFSQKECKLCVCLNLVYWGCSIISNFRNRVPIVKKNPLTVHFSIENISTWTNSWILEEPENPFF